MNKGMQAAVRVALVGTIMLLTMAAATASAQKGKPAPPPSQIPIVARFPPDATGANVKSDGSPYDWYTVYANRTTEGAYINTSGGIDINLVAGYSTRQMNFQIDEAVGSPGDPCYVPAGTYGADVVDFRFNPYGSQAGILNMNLGDRTSGFASIVNFSPTPALKNVVNGVTWTVSRLTLLYGAQSIDVPSNLTFTRNDTNLWTLASTARVPVQCMVTNGKRSVVYNPMDGGAFHNAFFSMTMALPK